MDNSACCEMASSSESAQALCLVTLWSVVDHWSVMVKINVVGQCCNMFQHWSRRGGSFVNRQCSGSNSIYLHKCRVGKYYSEISMQAPWWWHFAGLSWDVLALMVQTEWKMVDVSDSMKCYMSKNHQKWAKVFAERISLCALLRIFFLAKATLVNISKSREYDCKVSKLYVPSFLWLEFFQKTHSTMMAGETRFVNEVFL